MTQQADAPRKETAAQRVERIKREKPSWSILDDIRRYAREGFASIPEEDLSVRFRAWACTPKVTDGARAAKSSRSS
jgi:hypothetical protein